MAGFVELYIDQGTTFSSTMNLVDENTNAAINVDSYIVTGALKRSYNSANISANLTCTVTDAANGEISYALSSDETAALKAGRYFFDIVTVNTENVKSRIVEGIITITPGIVL